MTVKELKKKLEGVPDETFVFIKQENTEFPLSLVDDAKVVKAQFSEDTGPPISEDDVLLITDVN